MRISKDLATMIATAALAFRNEEIEKAEKDVLEFVDGIAKSSTPLEVLSAFELHPSYFKAAKSFHIFSDVNKTEKVRDSSVLTVVKPNGWQYGIVATDDWRLTRLEKLELTLRKLEVKLRADIEALETAIYQLRTKANVLRELPELENYFPSEMATALVPNFQNVRNLLKP